MNNNVNYVKIGILNLELNEFNHIPYYLHIYPSVKQINLDNK